MRDAIYVRRRDGALRNLDFPQHPPGGLHRKVREDEPELAGVLRVEAVELRS